MANLRFGDADTIARTGAFLQGELEKFDEKLYEPIAEYTWSRDIDVRTDVDVLDEISSFAVAQYGLGASGAGVGTKAWTAQGGTQIPSVSVAFGKKTYPVTPWSMSLDWDILELQKSMAVGRSLDQQKLNALRIRHQRDIDEQVYIGDKTINGGAGVKGLINSDEVSVESASLKLEKATDKDILGLINKAIEGVWANTQYQRVPTKILLPTSFAARFSDAVTIGGTPVALSLKEWVETKSLLSTITGQKLNIEFCRWLNKEQSGLANDRIVAYQQDMDVVRFPLVQLQNLPVQFRGMTQSTIYYGALGTVEFVRPELVKYVDVK